MTGGGSRENGSANDRQPPAGGRLSEAAAEVERRLDDMVDRLDDLAESVEAAVRDQESLRATLLGGERRLVEPGDDLGPVLRALEEPPAEPAFAAFGRRAAQPREHFAYQRLVHRIRGLVRAAVPAGAAVAVVSRGDEALLELGGRPAWHLPQTEEGLYAGHHPADGPAAVAALEALRARGAGYLLLPATAGWWLEHYPELRDHLARHFRPLVDEEDTCLIFEALRPPGEARP